MGRKRMPGLVKRGNTWHINKKVNGRRISESTQTSSLEEAEKYLVRRLEQIRQATVYGIRPKRSFREAATKFLRENVQKASLITDARMIQGLDLFIGHLPLEAIHMGSLQAYIQTRQAEGVKTRTVNYGLQVVRHILNLATSEWLDEYGLTWLASAPKIRLLPETDKRLPYLLNPQEQERLLEELPLHLKQMALFVINTGCRDQEVCRLQWTWEVSLPEGSVFIIPAAQMKNRQDRLVVLNTVTRSVIDEVRGQHSESVFTYQGRPHRMLNSAWKKARVRAGLPQVRVHGLETYLRSALTGCRCEFRG